MGNIIFKLAEKSVVEEGLFDLAQYVFNAFVENECIGIVKVKRIVRDFGRNSLRTDFYYKFERGDAYPIPVVSYMEVNKEHREKGIAGKLLEFANIEMIKNYKTPLYSSGPYNRESRQVYQKLEKEGKARKVPLRNQFRWELTQDI